MIARLRVKANRAGEGEQGFAYSIRHASARDAAFVLDRALESLSRIFGESPARIRGLLLSHNMHNWRNDPFASGAYSFITPGAADAPEELARPEQELLFFAGEATDLDFQFGTVHGAIASGRRAAS